MLGFLRGQINPYEKIMQKGYLLFLETRFAGKASPLPSSLVFPTCWLCWLDTAGCSKTMKVIRRASESHSSCWTHFCITNTPPFYCAGWIKRWAFISRPYLFVTDHEKDSVIRVVIRLSDITIQFNEDQVTAFPCDACQRLNDN